MRVAKEKIKIKQKAEKLGLLLSVCANAAFIVIELFVAYFSNSKAVLLDGLFDAFESALLLVSMRAMKLLYQPNSEKRPVGYSNLEPLYMIMKGLIFCVITVMMIVSSASTFLSGGYEVKTGIVFYFEISAGVISLAVFFVMRYINRQANSPVLALEIKEWKLDAAGSFGVGFAFLLAILAHATPLSFLSRYFDQIIMIILALYTLPTPVRAMRSGFRDLFFLSPGDKVLSRVKSEAYEVAALHGFAGDQLDFDVAKIGRRLWVSIYITVTEPTVDLQTFRDIQFELETRYISLADILDVDVIPEL